MRLGKWALIGAMMMGAPCFLTACDDEASAREASPTEHTSKRTKKKHATKEKSFAPVTRDQKALAALTSGDVRSRLRKLPRYAENKAESKGGADVITFAYGDPVNRGKTYAVMTVSFQRFDSPEKAAAFETGLRKAIKGRASTVVRGGENLLTITCHRVRESFEAKPKTCKPTSPALTELKNKLLKR